MKSWLSRFVFFLIVCLASPSYADVNLLNIDLGSPEGQRLSSVYGNAFGFTPQQVAPAMMAPAAETPSILRVAQAAGTIPLSIWMMRKLGMDYGQIISNFALGPTNLPGIPLSGGVTDATFIQSNQTYFLRDVLQVPPKIIPIVPMTGVDFSRAILYPYDPVNGLWLPPGIAKKYGLWVPPGQMNQIGWVPVSGQTVKVYHHKKWKDKKWKHKKFKGKKHRGWY